MPRKPVYTIPINKAIFKEIIKRKGFNIRSLTDKLSICSERTLRRALDNGLIRPIYLNNIAQNLDVDPRFLSGEIFLNDPKYKFYSLDYYYHELNKYPFSRKAFDEAQNLDIKNHLSNIFSLFNISYKQFENLDFEKKYNLQHDLFETIPQILLKYFSEDAYGNKDMYGLYQLVSELENYYEDYNLHLYAENFLRKQFLNNLPKGYSKSQIRSMTTDDLLDLDQSLQWDDLSTDKSN